MLVFYTNTVTFNRTSAHNNAVQITCTYLLYVNFVRLTKLKDFLNIKRHYLGEQVRSSEYT